MMPEPQMLTDPADQVRRAAAAPRIHADERWVEISDRVLAKALTVTRRSRPSRAANSGGRVKVSEQVLVGSIGEALRPVVVDEIRNRTKDVLRSLTGPVEPPVTVTTMHVHVEDVRPPRNHPSHRQPT